MLPSMRKTFALLVPVVAATGSDTDIGYELVYTSAGPDTPRTCFDAPKLDPPTLGSFFIGGPAKYEMGGYTFQSFFDGYGKFNRFELSKGQVCFTSKYMNTPYYKEAELLGRPAAGTFMGTDPPLPPCPLMHPLCKIEGSGAENNWVNIMPTNNASEGLALTDSPVFLRFDYETMETRGAYKWKDGGPSGMMPKWLKPMHAPATGSAHPVRRPHTESTYVEVMLEIGIHEFLAVYEIDIKTMDRSLIAHVPMNGGMYFHSFGASENYVVLPCNLKVNPKKMIGGSVLDAFENGWDGIHVVGRNGTIQKFQTDPFFHVHIANTFENATGIVLDLGTFDQVPFNAHTLVTKNNLNKTERDTGGALTKTERLHLHLAGPLQGTVTREELGLPGRMMDFFKINHNVWGLPYCIYYAVEWKHNDVDFANMAVLKHDVCQNKRSYWHKENTYVSEPYLLPRGSGTTPDVEDDGLLMFVALDGVRKASDFVILDGKTMEEIAIVHLAEHIPFLAHGQFIPKAAQAAKKALQVDHPELASVVDAFITV